jgi:ribonucleoside-diphosphate reductase alpha chain
MASSVGPQLPFSDALHAEKYRLKNEDYRGKCGRVSGVLSDNDKHFHEYYDITLDQRFLEAGRVQSGIGSPKRVTALNCYVSPTIIDSWEGISSAFHNAFATMRMGGGIGYEFSTLRPSGDLITKLDSISSGPLPFMDVFSALCHCIASTSARRGAQMATFSIDHPDIEAFILAKNDLAKLTGFNTSILVTDEFMEHKASGKPFPLRFNGRVYKEVDPVALWEMVMRSTWDYAEPGVIFIDTINRMNNLYYCENIRATNPCGEQPLPPNGACLLGSFNLVRYIKVDADGNRYFDWDLFIHDIPPVVRAMDNVIDNTFFPTEAQEAEAKNKRRMGLGFTGLANAGEALGFAYGSQEFIDFELQILDNLNHYAYLASSAVAKEKGSFPAFDAELYLAGEYVKDLDQEVRDAIRKDGLRNSHLTSIAPTGTISFAHDYVSSGCEPVFGFPVLDRLGNTVDHSYEGARTVNLRSGKIETTVSDYGYRVFGTKGKMSHDVTAAEHVDVLLAAANRVDSSVSKTINMDGNMPWDDFKNIYQQVWERGGKGCTTFNKDGKKMGILLGTVKDDPDNTAEEIAEFCVINPDGSKDCS